MHRLVLLRHGESEWNRQNRFTGWQDVDLSPKGLLQAKQAGIILSKAGYSFDLGYTSYLKRAIKTLHLSLEELDLLWIPEIKAWELNERHYGALEGLNKAEMAKNYNEEQVFAWRRGFKSVPPLLNKEDKRSVTNDSKYLSLHPSQIPFGESLEEMMNKRVIPYWTEQIVPQILLGRKIIISAHGNSLRGLVKHLDKISDKEIEKIDIPTGAPLVYELDARLQPIKHYYLE
ncbi:MAG TPA: 2,3-diphosphoglycerate-dependent phosphoglycerate mutase [Puia sp.]